MKKLSTIQIDKIKPKWKDEVPFCRSKVLGSPPLASKDGCEYFSISGAPREPSEETCDCPGCEQKEKSIGICLAAIKYKMARK